MDLNILYHVPIVSGSVQMFQEYHQGHKDVKTEITIILIAGFVILMFLEAFGLQIENQNTDFFRTAILMLMGYYFGRKEGENPNVNR